MSRIVDRGPPADAAAAAAEFRRFWGDRAELRRFKDGAIVEAVVWQQQQQQQHAKGSAGGGSGSGVQGLVSSFVTDAPTVVEAIVATCSSDTPAWCGGSASSSSSSNNGVLASPLSPFRVAFIGNQMQARLLDYGGGVDGVDGGSGDEDNYGSAVRRGIAALEEPAAASTS